MSNVPPPPLNPFRPGSRATTYISFRQDEKQDAFRHMLRQAPVSQNAIVTGLRGVGKTVLLETLKPIAHAENWLWTGNDLSESTSLSEDRIARRLIVDLSALLGPIVTVNNMSPGFGFNATPVQTARPLQFEDLWNTFDHAPGLVLDKLQAVFTTISELIKNAPIKGIVFAYDEAQNLADHAATKEYPLSLILDLFSWLQRKTFSKNFMLVLTGLPTLFQN